MAFIYSKKGVFMFVIGLGVHRSLTFFQEKVLLHFKYLERIFLDTHK